MPAAVLFRGHAHRPPKDGFSSREWGTDWRPNLDSHRRFLIDPLRDRYGAVDVFLCTYEMPYDSTLHPQLLRDYSNEVRSCHLRYSISGHSQRQTFLVGALMVADAQRELGNYDLVATCRFDIELLKCPLDHGTFRPDAVNLLWREWEQKAWDDHRRVPDAIHLLPGELLDWFRHGVAETPSEICLHMIYYPVSRYIGSDRMHVMEPDGFRDSNTDKEPNPVYKMRRVL